LPVADALVSPRTQGINPPGKLLSYLASGKPVVATDTLVHNQLLNDNCAILTTPDARGLAQGLVTGLTDPVRVAEVVNGAANSLPALSRQKRSEMPPMRPYWMLLEEHVSRREDCSAASIETESGVLGWVARVPKRPLDSIAS